jgi:mannose-6-phosphate isomerase-like protein (cupin superfamily)
MVKTLTKDGEREVKSVERLRGGAGHVLMENLLDQEGLDKAGRLFAKLTLKPGCEVGHHEHHDEIEAYYILSGTGMYEDNGKAMDVEPGDVLFCDNGQGHGIKNVGTEDLVFIALVLYR